jgi:hypothetical protein
LHVAVWNPPFHEGDDLAPVSAQSNVFGNREVLRHSILEENLMDVGRVGVEHMPLVIVNKGINVVLSAKAEFRLSIRRDQFVKIPPDAMLG